MIISLCLVVLGLSIALTRNSLVTNQLRERYLALLNKIQAEESRKLIGPVSHEVIRILSDCQGSPNDNGILTRGELDRDKIESDLMTLLIRVKKLEFELQDTSAKVYAYKESLNALNSFKRN